MNFFYYKNVAQKIRFLTFTNNFAHWLNMEHTCCMKGLNTIQPQSTSYFTEHLNNFINSAFKYVYV